MAHTVAVAGNEEPTDVLLAVRHEVSGTRCPWVESRSAIEVPMIGGSPATESSYRAKSGSGRPLRPGRTANTLPDNG